MYISKNPDNMRLRVRYSPAATRGFVTVLLDEVGTSYPLQPSKDSVNYEYILDTHQRKQEGLKHFFNPCFHDHLFQTSEGLNELTVWSTELGQQITWSFDSANCIKPNQFWEICRTLPLGYSDAEVADFCVRAEHHFRTAIDVEVLTYNLMLDTFNLIKEFKKLLTGCIERSRKFAGDSHAWVRRGRRENYLTRKERYLRRGLVRRLRKDYVGDGSPSFALKKTSNGWLIWNFAVKPTLKDLRTIRDAHKKVTKRLKFLRSINGNTITVDYREGIKARSETFSFSSGSCFPPADLGVSYVKPQDTALEVDCIIESQLCAHAQVKFDIDTAILYSESAYRHAMAVYLGLYAVGSTIWEGIPFSFVIDWFLSEKMKTFPEMFDYSPFKDAEIFAVYHSIKSTAFGETFLVAPPASPAADDQRLLMSGFAYKSYQRQGGYPTQGSPLFREPWSGFHISLSAALVFQRWKR